VAGPAGTSNSNYESDQGGLPNQFDTPSAIAVDSRDNLFVADSGNGRVQEWPAGAKSGFTVAGGHGSGSALDQLNSPWSLAIDAHDDVFVSDINYARVMEWTPGATNGIIVAGGHGWGSAADQLENPSEVFADGHGHLYVADTWNNRVEEVTLPVPAAVASSATALSYYTTTSDAEAPGVNSSDTVVLVATVTPIAGTVATTGTVTFYDGTTDLGTATLYAHGTTAYAVLYLDPLAVGAHHMSAAYGGDYTFKPSTSPAVAVAVVAK
jgi:hypothetical protein